MTKIAIMQPYFFPYLGYFQLIDIVDKFIIYDNINYIKKGWINRNRLSTLKGKSKFFTLPLVHPSSNKLIKDTLTQNNCWRYKLKTNLQHNYKKSHFYEETMEIINSCLCIETSQISILNTHCLKIIASHLDIDTQLISDVDFQGLENQIKEKLQSVQYDDGISRKETRVISICNHYKSNTYINAIGGQSLYNKSTFKKENINLQFLKMNKIYYDQDKSYPFVENLSIIDVLMNCGKIKTQNLLNACSLAS